MKPARALLAMGLLSSQTLLADNIEERTWPVTSFLTPNPFQLNPAAVATDRTIIGGLRGKRTEESHFTANPNNNPSEVKHTTTKSDIGFGFQLPLGGASFGVNFDEHSRQVSGDSSQGNNDAFEEFWVRDWKMKFAVDLLPELRGGFTFRYQSLESDLLGGYNIDDDDRTRYKGTMSGYSIGLSYRIQSFSIGAFSAPPLRGKVTIEGEQKIISDPGLGGVELGRTWSDRLSIGLSALRWFYKHDERDEAATSPGDQRDIFLRGVDIDQYFRKTQAIGVSAEFAILPVAGIKGGITQTSGVFLFDPSKVPGDNKDVETKLTQNEVRIGGFLRNKQFFAELMLLKAARSKKGTISVNRNNIRELGDYKHDESSNVVVLGAVF